jgi:hypothetical protein
MLGAFWLACLILILRDFAPREQIIAGLKSSREAAKDANVGRARKETEIARSVVFSLDKSQDGGRGLHSATPGNNRSNPFLS